MDPRDRMRLDELLADRATERLDPESQRELQALLAAAPEAADDDRFDHAAAALELALLVGLDEMPKDVRARLALQGRAWVERMRRN